MPVLHGENCWAVIDAVLYNRKEILQILSSKGICLKSQVSDEELLFSLIQNQGYEMLAEVNGDFAGAVYNRIDSSWTLFRDHVGVRPLYVYEDQMLYAFSTEQRALLAIPGIDSGPDKRWIRRRLEGWNSLSVTETFYEKIRMLPPAGIETVQSGAGGIFQKKQMVYWTLKARKLPQCTDKEYIQGLRETVTRAVVRRLNVFPGTVGAELSGGLDSSVIGVLINRLGRESEWVSWSMPPDELPIQKRDERSVIFDLCRQEQKKCHFLRSSQADTMGHLFRELFPPFVNTLPLERTAEGLSRDGIRVVFSGQGGDEGVSHRANLTELWYQGEKAAFIAESWRRTEGKNFRILRLIKNLAVSLFIIYPRYFRPRRFPDSDLSEFLTYECKKQKFRKEKNLDFRFGIDPIHYIQSGGERPRLENTAFQASKHGVRYVFPYLDREVLEYAVSLPRRLFLHKGINRYIYREAFKDLMPDSLYHVDYKDMPSLEGYSNRSFNLKEIAGIFRKEQELLENSDFSSLLDLPKAFAFLNRVYSNTEKEHSNNEQKMKAAALSNALLCCCLAEQLRKYAKDGPRTEDSNNAAKI